MAARPNLVQSRQLAAPSLVEKRFLLEAAFLYQARGRPAEAIAILRGLLELAEDQAALHFHLGGLHMELDQPEAATGHFDEAVHLAPAWPLVVERLSEALRASGRIEAAEVARVRFEAMNRDSYEYQAPCAGRGQV